MKNDNLLKLGGLALMGWLFLEKKDEAPQGENLFQIKDGRIIPESQMVQNGYVKFGGRWVLASDLALAAGQMGITNTTTINPRTPKGLQILNLLFNAGQTLTASIIHNTNAIKKDLIMQIKLKYMITHSPNYNANFAYTIAQLNTFGLRKLKDIFKNGR